MSDKVKMISVGKLDEIMEERFPVSETFDYYGEELIIRKVIPFSVFAEIVQRISDLCFNSETGEYMPESLDFAERLCVTEAYTNVRLPRDMEKQYQILYRTDLWNYIVSIIDSDQYSAMMNAIYERIKIKNDTNRKEFEDMLMKSTSLITDFAKDFTDLVGGINVEDLQNLVKAIGDGGIDEGKLAEAVILAQNKKLDETVKDEDDKK